MDQEIRLKSEWLYKHTHVPHDEISLSDNIQNCAYELIRSNSGEGDSPISMIAATCVAKESELIVERLSCHPVFWTLKNHPTRAHRYGCLP